MRPDMPTRALGIMGKAPIAGKVKTRLAPPLTANQAALLYRAFLRDAILNGLAIPGCSVAIVHPPMPDREALRELLSPGVSSIEQRGDGLGEGLLGAFRQLWELGARDVVLIGSDSPSLPSNLVIDAFEHLESGDVDVVLGPAADGGYYLIGLRDDHPRLFENITWSTDRVLCETLDRADEAGLRVTQIAPWYDVDDDCSLHQLVNDLGTNPHLHAPATRAALQTLRRNGGVLPLSPLPWPVTRTQRHYTSAWRNFDSDLVTTHHGQQIDYTYFATPDAVWIVPVTPDGDIVFVRQYRPPVRDWCLETPAGTLGDEPLIEAAERELREEIGGTTHDLRYIGAFYPSSGHLTLRGHVFLALDVELSVPSLEATEMLVPVRIPAEVAFDMARRGEVNEGQSALAVLFCERAIRDHLALRDEP